MNDQLIAAIVAEFAPALAGRATFGKVWQLSRVAVAIDLRLSDGRALLISADPAAPRLYLSARPVRELEKQSLAPSNFALALRKHLGGARLLSVTKDAGERVVRFNFAAYDVVGETHDWMLIAQLTGRAANLLLLDAAGRIVDALRPPRGEGQEIADIYQPPPQQSAGTHPRTGDDNSSSSSTHTRTVEDARETANLRTHESADARTHESAETLTHESAETRANDNQPARQQDAAMPFTQGAHDSLSAAADAYYRALEAARAFDARVASHRARLRQSIEKQRKLQRNLERDAAAHGDAETHKRVGDLLLANIANAERRGASVRVTDYFTEGAPIIELEIDEHASLPEEAARRFARYTKAKRAAQEIAARLAELNREINKLELRQQELERIVAARDADALAEFDAAPKAQGARGRHPERSGGTKGSSSSPPRTKAQVKAAESVAGARRYRSSDGYEILVGRAAKDNDQLTFKVARAHDLWLHAADYPGSHVVVRNHTRTEEVPHRTVIEAAQLAAYFSQAKADAKVSVHYTTRKFLSKPKGSAPGLVRMSSFRSLLVEPREGVERL